MIRRVTVATVLAIALAPFVFSKTLAKHPVSVHSAKVTKAVELALPTIQKNTRSLANFGVFEANMSTQFVIHYVAFLNHIPSGNEWDHINWTEIPPIPRTCETTNLDVCKQEQHYVLMATVNCGYQGYCLIAYQQPSTGKWWAAAYQDPIVADCDLYSGVLLGLAD